MSREVLKGSHKTGSIESKFLFLHPMDALQIRKCIFLEALCIKMHGFCINTIPVGVAEGGDNMIFSKVIMIEGGAI